MTDRLEFRAGTTSSLRQEYLERLKYQKYVQFEGMIDIWYENYDYGLLSDNFTPVVTIEDNDTSRRFIGYADGVGALNFVAAAFSEFRDSFIEKTNSSTIGFPPYMQGLIPKAGFTSFDNTYASWLTYCAIKYSSYLQSDLSIVNYSTFLESIKNQLVRHLRRFPITKSGFCLSSRNDIKTTGLAIELSDLDPNIDTHKGEIVQDLNFRCFVEEATKFGFYVDKNVPWRLLANLDSKVMRLYIRGLDTDPGDKDFNKHFKEEMKKDEEHKHLSTMDILNSIYRTKTHLDDLFHVQDFIIKIYNQIVLEVPYYTKMEYRSHNNSYEKISVFRTGVDFLKTEEWLDLLIMVRLLELDSYEELRYNKICQKSKNVFKSYGLRQALSIIGTEMAKIIKEEFTKAEKQDIIADETTEERTNRNANTTRIIYKSPGSPISGY